MLGLQPGKVPDASGGAVALFLGSVQDLGDRIIAARLMGRRKDW